MGLTSLPRNKQDGRVVTLCRSQRVLTCRQQQQNLHNVCFLFRSTPRRVLNNKKNHQTELVPCQIHPLSNVFHFFVFILTRTNIEETTLTGLTNCLRFKINNQTNKNKKQQQKSAKKIKLQYYCFIRCFFFNIIHIIFLFFWLMLAPHKTVLKCLLRRSSNGEINAQN